MQRYKIKIEYDGTAFVGWQFQKNGLSIQEVLQNAIFNFSKEKVVITGAGRTDSGVHALAQVAHFDLHTDMKVLSIKDALNGNLPRDIKVMEVFEVNENFHARFSATKRHYKYRLRTDGFFLDRNFTWHTEPLELKILNKSAITLLGENDFTSFSRKNENLEHRRCIIYESITKAENQVLNYQIVANRFLHHMVRYLVGTMVEIARGKYKFDQFVDLIKTPKENVNIFKAPPHGLVLTKVDYEIN